MAKKVLNLQYGIGPEFFTGHITHLGGDAFRAFLIADGKTTARRDLTRAEYDRLNDELWDACGENPEFDFSSIWPLQDFVQDGVFPADRSKRRAADRELASLED